GYRVVVVGLDVVVLVLGAALAIERPLGHDWSPSPSGGTRAGCCLGWPPRPGAWVFSCPGADPRRRADAGRSSPLTRAGAPSSPARGSARTCRRAGCCCTGSRPRAWRAARPAQRLRHHPERATEMRQRLADLL